MKKTVLILLILTLTACGALEKDLARDIVSSATQKLSLCEIEGDRFKGLADLNKKNGVLKVLIIHGVGTHKPGYSDKLQLNLMNEMGVAIRSRLPKNLTLYDPVLKKHPIGNLRVTAWEKENKKILFYELTWSEITQPYKNELSFDTSEKYAEFRVSFNNTMKSFFDNTLPDPMIYLVDPHQFIVHSAQQAFCWMLKTDWDSIPATGSVCSLPLNDEVERAGRQNISFITHSLGSEIVMDVFQRMADKIAAAPDVPPVGKLQNKTVSVFLLANQLPILRIAKGKPKINNQIKKYCFKNSKDYRRRFFKKLNIVAFTDPNDLLSYPIPQPFADDYFDSRMCPFVTNAFINVAPEISAFGVGLVNPVAAHVNYENNEKVIGLIVNGTVDFNSDAKLKKQCKFILLKDNIR